MKASEYKVQCLFPKIKRTKDIKLMLSSLNRLHISSIFFKKTSRVYTNYKYSRNMVPLGDHLGSVGDSTTSGLPPATQTRLAKSLQTPKANIWD